MAKKAHVAFWFAPSFNAIEFNKEGRIKSYFLGSHKPRNLENIKTEPNLDDLRPKADLVVIDNNKESIPFPAREIPKLIAAIARVSSDGDIIDKARGEMERFVEKFEYGNSTYLERNFHDLKEDQIIALAQDNGRLVRYYNQDPIDRPNQMQWLKKGFVYYERETGSDTSNVIPQIIAIGKDEKHNLPVIGVRKEIGFNTGYKNFISIIPLTDDGLNMIFSLLFLVYYKPKVRFITVDTLEEKLSEYALTFHGAGMAAIDFCNDPIDKIMDALK